MTGIRYWSTPDYTRVAIDLEDAVPYQAGRVPNPERIFFDLHNTKLAPALVAKQLDVQDTFLRRIRIAQYQKTMTRVVLEVDDVADYSAFLLPNPDRLIIDIHGRQPKKTTNVAESKSPAPARPAAVATETGTTTPAVVEEKGRANATAERRRGKPSRKQNQCAPRPRLPMARPLL